MTRFLLGMTVAALLFQALDVALAWLLAALLSFAISK